MLVHTRDGTLQNGPEIFKGVWKKMKVFARLDNDAFIFVESWPVLPVDKAGISPSIGYLPQYV